MFQRCTTFCFLIMALLKSVAGCIRAFLTIRKSEVSKNGVPYFKERQICRKPEILILRKTALAKVGIPYFEDSQFSKKPSFLTIRIARFLKSQNPYGKEGGFCGGFGMTNGEKLTQSPSP